MPELPEVETVRQGLKPYLLTQQFKKIIIRRKKLRYPLPESFEELCGKPIIAIKRRAKYLMIETTAHRLILHLGMSGSISVFKEDTPPRKHDHLIFILDSGMALFFNDPRRFGFVQAFPLTDYPPYLEKLAPEPLSEDFNADYLYTITKNSKQAIKAFIMDQRKVVGVGNIYASEALFQARIHPLTKASFLTKEEVRSLVDCIKSVLRQAIIQGGTTLKDFANPEGSPGYFAQELLVYGRKGVPCFVCGKPITSERIAQRSTFYCQSCQVLKKS